MSDSRSKMSEDYNDYKSLCDYFKVDYRSDWVIHYYQLEKLLKKEQKRNNKIDKILKAS